MTITIELKNLDRKTFTGDYISLTPKDAFFDVSTEFIEVKVDDELKLTINKDVIAFIEHSN